MALFEDAIENAIEGIRTKMCEAYGVPNEDEMNDELSEFVEEITRIELKPVIEIVRRIISGQGGHGSQGGQGGQGGQGDQGGQGGQGDQNRGQLASIEAKLDRLLQSSVAKPAIANVAANDIGHDDPVGPPKAPTTNSWTRYQRIWGCWKRSINEVVPKEPGARTKACATDYQNKFKTLSPTQKEEFLATWGA